MKLIILIQKYDMIIICQMYERMCIYKKFLVFLGYLIVFLYVIRSFCTLLVLFSEWIGLFLLVVLVNAQLLGLSGFLEHVGGLLFGLLLVLSGLGLFFFLLEFDFVLLGL